MAARKQAATVQGRASASFPQGLALYPTLTAAENLRMFGEMQRIAAPELRDRVAWALQWTGLADRAREPVKRFSGGMKRRLNIACGVLHRPSVVLLDEPTVGVDPQSRERIWEMLDGLRNDGASLLLTTHQLDEAQKVCDRIVIIDHGRDIAAGTLAELIAQTVGPARRVTLLLDRPPDAARLGGDGVTIDGPRLTFKATDSLLVSAAAGRAVAATARPDRSHTRVSGDIAAAGAALGAHLRC